MEVGFRVLRAHLSIKGGCLGSVLNLNRDEFGIKRILSGLF